MGATGRTQQQTVALAMVTGTFRTRRYFHQATVTVLAMTGRNTFRHDRTFRILTQVDHLRSGICLLVIVGYSNRIELTDRIIAGQDTTRVFPGNGRTGFHLWRPYVPLCRYTE